MALKPLLRRLILATAVPPLLQIYRSFYTFVIGRALRLFRDFPEIKAVYLRRGGGAGALFPLISDLDFAIFVDGLGESRKRELLGRYESLGRLTTVLDHFLEIYDVDGFESLYRRSRRQYRFMEGRANWKLLAGEPFMNRLPALAIEEMQHGLFRELKIWWTVFAWRQIQKGRYYSEPATRNSICCKVTAEVLKMELGLLHGELLFDKERALALSPPLLEADDRAHVDEIRGILRRHYRGGDSELPDRTTRFLVKRLQNLADALPGHALGRPVPGVAIRLDDSGDPRETGSERDRHLRAILSHVKQSWGEVYRGAALVGGFYFDTGERALVLAVDPGRFPSIERLRALYELHRESSANAPPFLLYVLAGRPALQIDVDYYRRGWIAVLTPESTPDVFLQLADRAYTVDGVIDATRFRGSGGARSPLPWTEIADSVVREEREAALEDLAAARPAPGRALRNAWRYGVMQASLAQGVALVPLNGAAVLRGAARHAPVTILMPCRNGDPDLLREAFASVRAQTDPCWRLIVIDDGSDDAGTLGALDEIAASNDPRVSRIASEARMVTGALNTGMRRAETEFVCMFHCDDILAPDAVAVLGRAIAAHPDVDYFHSSRVHVDEHGAVIAGPFPARETFTVDDFKVGGPVKHLHAWRVRTALDAGGMDETLGPHGADDYDFPWTLAEAGCRFRAIPECLYHYRDRGDQKRLTTHVPLETQVRELEKIFRKHGMTDEEIAEQIAIRKAGYLRQALYERDEDVPAE